MFPLQDYCSTTYENPLNGRPSSTQIARMFSMTIVCCIDNHDFIHKYAALISRPSLLRRPRLLLVSTLLTWSGLTSPCTTPIDATNEFLKRTPAPGYMEEYNRENLLWSTCLAYKSGLHIVSIGRIYGKNG